MLAWNRLLIPIFLVLTCLMASGEQSASWVWRHQKDRPPPAGERAWLRHSFAINTKIEKATLECAAAGAMEIYVNGKKIASSPEYRQPVKADVTSLVEGYRPISLAAFARNKGGQLYHGRPAHLFGGGCVIDDHRLSFGS